MLPELNRSNCYKYTTSPGEVVMMPSRVCKLFVKLPAVSLLTVSVVVILVIYHIDSPRLGHNCARTKFNLVVCAKCWDACMAQVCGVVCLWVRSSSRGFVGFAAVYYIGQ